VPLRVRYQLVLINSGGFASPWDAEMFGASSFSRDEYAAEFGIVADRLAGCGQD